MSQIVGETENERKVLDLTEEDIKRIGIILTTEMNGKKVSEYSRRIRTLDNGISKEKDQLLRVTEEEGHTKVSLHTNQSNEANKGHIKMHLKDAERIMAFLTIRYDEEVIADVVAPRISYEVGNGEDCIDLDIDFFPAIPPFMEIDLANLRKHGLTLEQLLSVLGLEEHNVVKLMLLKKKKRVVKKHYKRRRILFVFLKLKITHRRVIFDWKPIRI